MLAQSIQSTLQNTILLRQVQNIQDDGVPSKFAVEQSLVARVPLS